MAGRLSDRLSGFRALLRTLGFYDCVHTAIGLLLLTAGLLGWQSGVLSSKWALVGFVSAELFLAFCLLLNLRPAHFREAIDLIRAWGFDYRSYCLLLDNVRRDTKYWDSPEDFLLLVVRGEPTFTGHGQSGLVELKRSRVFLHEEIMDLIGKVSPGPYLEMFGNHGSGRDEWASCDAPDCSKSNQQREPYQ